MAEHFHARSAELSWREVDGEIVLLDERDWTYLHLNGTGATIWKALGETGASLEAVIEALVAEYDVDRVVAATDAMALIAELVERGLVEVAS